MGIIARMRSAIDKAVTKRRLEKDRTRLLIIQENGTNWNKVPINVWSNYQGKDMILYKPEEVDNNIRTIDKMLKQLDPPADMRVAA